MKITNEFTVHTPIDRAWQVLTDLEGIAPCMPGAQLTGVEGDTYKGKVKVKVGPVISEFAGTARFAERDEAGHRAVIDAKGRDARAGGNASALVSAVLTPDGESTRVSVDTDLKISGKLAQFGSGMIKEVSGKLLAQFVNNLEAKLAAETAAPGDAKPDETAPGTATTDQVAPFSATTDADILDHDGAEAVGTDRPAADQPTSDQKASEPVAAIRETTPAPAEVAQVAGEVSPAAASTSTPAPADVVPAQGGPAARVGPASASAPAPAEVTPAPAKGSTPVTTEEPEPLDLLSVAGSSIYKRAIPLLVGVVAVGAIIVWAVARR